MQKLRAPVGRRELLLGGAASLAATALPAPAIARGFGDFRMLSLTNWRTEEKVTCVYWADGAYIPEAMNAFNYILRDWRQEVVATIDPSVIDILARTQGKLGSDEPFEIVSGFRTATTNNTLRRRGRGVAKKSYHTRAMAVDIAMKTRSVRQIAAAGEAVNRGGVGRYSRSEFVHLDSGPLRTWGR